MIKIHKRSWRQTMTIHFANPQTWWGYDNIFINDYLARDHEWKILITFNWLSNSPHFFKLHGVLVHSRFKFWYKATTSSRAAIFNLDVKQFEISWSLKYQREDCTVPRSTVPRPRFTLDVVGRTKSLENPRTLPPVHSSIFEIGIRNTSIFW